MSDDRFGEDVRIPQAASVSTNRRKTQAFAITATSSTHQVRDPASSDGECYLTLWHNVSTGVVRWHGGPDSVAVPLPAATANDWVLPQNTERSYKLAAKETHISVICVGGGSETLYGYISSD